jgi:heme-degrading monooxygenase HmoA
VLESAAPLCWLVTAATVTVMAAQVALGAALGAAAATACATMRPDSCTDAARAGPEPPPPRVPRFEAPYTAVIFSSLRRGSSSSADDGYGEMGAEMAAMAAVQPGYLGVESSRDSNGFGLTVSYWRTAADALAWKSVARHGLAQQRGRDEWYRYYTTRVATVERCYSHGD